LPANRIKSGLRAAVSNAGFFCGAGAAGAATGSAETTDGGLDCGSVRGGVSACLGGVPVSLDGGTSSERSNSNVRAPSSLARVMFSSNAARISGKSATFSRPRHAPEEASLPLKPYGFIDCQRQRSAHIVSMPRSAFQPSSLAARDGSAQHSATSPGRRGLMT